MSQIQTKFIANEAVISTKIGSQTATAVQALFADGSGGATFRSILPSDIPTLNQNTTGTAANVSGTVAIANGGTGATGGSAAFQNLNRSAALRETASGTLVIGGNYNIWTGGGALTMYLPAAASTAYGDKIYITNLELTWATNNFTIAAPASTVYINQVSGGSLVCNVNAGGFTLVCSWQDGTNAFWVVQ